MHKYSQPISLIFLILCTAISSCSPNQESIKRNDAPPPQKIKPQAEELKPQRLPSLPEPTQPVVAVNIYQTQNYTDSQSNLLPIVLDKNQAQDFLDIRGVGDSGMALTHQQPFNTQSRVYGVPANFGQRLDAFDPTGKVYRGDLSFINWESTIGKKCNQFWAARNPRAFAFMSHPDNMLGLYKRGFNLIGLANNHTRDCPDAEEGVDGAFASSRHMAQITQIQQPNWLWHGVGRNKKGVVRTFAVKGKPIRVAFASLYLAEGDCTYVTCLKDELTVLRSLRDAEADIRILAMHSWTNSTQRRLVNIGVNFLRHYDGDIVFGNGPHRFAPIRIVESARGDKKGVMFESLGNFIHPSLIASSQHLIGRALFDLNTLKLKQIQAIPIAVNRLSVSFSGTPNPTKLPANITWKYVQDQTWQSGVNSKVRAAYSNVKMLSLN